MILSDILVTKNCECDKEGALDEQVSEDLGHIVYIFRFRLFWGDIYHRFWRESATHFEDHPRNRNGPRNPNGDAAARFTAGRRRLLRGPVPLRPPGRPGSGDLDRWLLFPGLTRGGGPETETGRAEWEDREGFCGWWLKGDGATLEAFLFFFGGAIYNSCWGLRDRTI